MSCRIAGTGWVTPSGGEVAGVWKKLCAGEVAPLDALVNEQNGARYLVHRVGSAPKLPPHPRLRRASAISRFAAAAGLAALGGKTIDAQRTALVFAIANGGVIYTGKFYGEIVEQGAQAASPLLFPETVFNAPASHLAAMLEITGASYTIVGDGAVGVLALKFAEDLIASSHLDAVLLVGAEELDALVCEAYRSWRLLRNPDAPTGARGMIVSEGAGAVLLTRDEGDVEVAAVDAGVTYFRRADLPAKMKNLAQRIDAAAWITSANGTFVDRAEHAALPSHAPRWSPKRALGDSVGASALWQIVAATEALRTGSLPGSEIPVGNSIGIVNAGINQQLGGILLRSTHGS